MTTAVMTRTDLLACPECTGEICPGAKDLLICRNCGRAFGIDSGIPLFAPSDTFYDDYAEEGHCPHHLSPSGWKKVVLQLIPSWSSREWQFWRAAVPSCRRLLDIGCGRGRQLFAERAEEPVGFDASLRFARDCANHYRFVAVGTLPRLPFRSGAFDVAVSSHLIGHIAVECKDTLISELARTLRPGGVTAHIIETDSAHPIVAAAKMTPAAYRRQFIEQDGHIGLEPAARVVARFERHGFRLKTLRMVDALVPSLQNYRKYLSAPEFAGLPGMSALKWLNRSTTEGRTAPVANAAYEVLMGGFHRTVEQWFGQLANAQFIMVSFVKEQTP